MKQLDKKLLAERLNQAFGKDIQDVVARKLNTTQGNVSKWRSGQQVPTTDFLYSISRAYSVSIDWLLGLSDEKDIDGIALENLTYEQIARVIDYLITNGNIIVPDLQVIKREAIEEAGYDPPEEDDDDGMQEEFDPDYLLLKDRVLSSMFRRRAKIYQIGEDYVSFWKDNTLLKYKGAKLLNYNGNMESAIDTRSWATFTEGDWVELIKTLNTMSEEERAALIEKANKEKGGKNNGR